MPHRGRGRGALCLHMSGLLGHSRAVPRPLQYSALTAQIMATSDQRLLGRVILEFQRRREQLLETPLHPLRGGRQTHLTDFFLTQRLGTTTPPTPRPKGVTADRAEELRARRRPRLAGYHAPRLYHQEIAAIRARHEHEIQRRVDRLRSAPAVALRGAFTPPSPMYTPS